MKEVKFYCDRCGKEIEPPVSRFAFETEHCHKTKTSDLCPECYRKFLQFMKGGKKDDSSNNSAEC